MMNWYVEKRPFASSATHMLAWDIARHLYTRRLEGPVLIVCPRPFTLLRVVRKQWLRLIRSVQRERSKTLNLGRVKELSDGLQHMQTLTFTSKITELPSADIFFATPAEALQLSTHCATAYVVGPLDNATLRALERIVPETGLIVAYEEVELVAR